MKCLDETDTPEGAHTPKSVVNMAKAAISATRDLDVNCREHFEVDIYREGYIAGVMKLTALLMGDGRKIEKSKPKFMPETRLSGRDINDGSTE